MPKKLVSREKYLVFRGKHKVFWELKNFITLNTEYLIHYPKNQSGIAQIFVVLLLLAGVGLGTYLVQNRTNFLPFADCNPGIDNDCDSGGGSEEGDPEGYRQEEEKREEQDLERGAEEAGKPLEEYKDDDCKANPGKESCRKREAEKRAREEAEGGGEPEEDDVSNCRSTSCNDPRSLDGQLWSSLPKDVRDLFEGEYCGVKKREDGSTYIPHCQEAKVNWMRQADNNFGKQVEECNSDPNKAGCDEVLKKEEDRKSGKNKDLSETVRLQNSKLLAEAATSDKEALDAIRKAIDPNGIKFKAELTDSENVAGCVGSYNEHDPEAQTAIRETCEKEVKLLKDISNGQQKLDESRQKIDDCLKSTEEGACDVVADASYRNAVINYRAAMRDAVEKGIPGAIYKADFGSSANPIYVNVGGQETKAFVGCDAKDKNFTTGECKIKIFGRSPDGKLSEISEDEYIKLGVTPGGVNSLGQLPQKFHTPAEDICKTRGIGCSGLGGQSATSGSSGLKYEKADENKCLDSTGKGCFEGLSCYLNRSNNQNECISAQQAGEKIPTQQTSVQTGTQAFVGRGDWEHPVDGSSIDCPASCGERLTCVVLKSSPGEAVCYPSAKLESKIMINSCTRRGVSKTCQTGEYCGTDGLCHDKANTKQ